MQFVKENENASSDMKSGRPKNLAIARAFKACLESDKKSKEKRKSNR